MAKHGVTFEFDDDDEVRRLEASWELMDLAEARWEPFVLKAFSPRTKS